MVSSGLLRQGKSRRSRAIKPPSSVYVYFCLTCGRNDLVTPLSERHWTAGKLCNSKLVRLRYALVQDGNNDK